MPAMFGKEAKKKELIKTLDALYAQLQREHKINAGDFPDLEKMKKDLVHQDFSKFRGFDKVIYLENIPFNRRIPTITIVQYLNLKNKFLCFLYIFKVATWEGR